MDSSFKTIETMLFRLKTCKTLFQIRFNSGCIGFILIYVVMNNIDVVFV